MRDFASPPAAYFPQLQWFWNAMIDRGEIHRQLAQIASGGVREVLIQPHRYIAPRYLTEEWFAAMRAALTECAATDFHVWLGDDTDLPGGSAGGRLVRERPELRCHYLNIQSEDIPAAAAPRWAPPAFPGELVWLSAAPLTGDDHTPDFTASITLSQFPLNKAPYYLAKLDADVRVYIFSQVVDTEYVDIMNPATSAYILAKTHAEYRLAMPEFFGNTLAGFAARAPALRSPSTPVGAMRFPWSPQLVADFAIQPGYNLLEWLPALIANVGDDAARLRQDFWMTVLRLTRQAYWEPLCQHAERAGLAYAGHPQQDESQIEVVANYSDIVPALETMQRPGIVVPAILDTGERGAPVLLQARLAATVATLKGRPRSQAQWPEKVDWATTPGQRLRGLHQLLLQGINSFVAAHAGVSLAGQRHSDGACSDIHQPYWAQWDHCAAYIGRCCYALSQGRAGARVAVLWPMRSSWAHYNPIGHRLTRWVEEDLQATATLLDELHFDYLLLPEEDIVKARCHESGLWCGEASHRIEMLVLPSVTALSWDAWRQIEKFVACGGQVVCLGLLPRWSEHGRDNALEAHISKTTLITVAHLYEAYAEMESETGEVPPTVGYPITHSNEAGGRLSCYQPRLNPDAEDARRHVRRLLKESLAPELETQSEQVYYTRRVISPVAVDASTENGKSSEDTTDAATTAPTTAPISDFDWDREFDWDERELSNLADDTEDETNAAESSEPPEEDLSEAATLAREGIVIATEESLDDKDLLPGGDVFFVLNNAEEPAHINLRLVPTLPGVPYHLDLHTGAVRRHPVWMPFPDEEGGGFSITLDLAAQETHCLWVRPLCKPVTEFRGNLERATFVVDTFDGSVATGYATESGEPRIAVREGERLIRVTGEAVKVPAPILLPDTWQAVRSGPNVLVTRDWEWQRGWHAPGARHWFGADRWQPLATLRSMTPVEAAARQRAAHFETTGQVTYRTTVEILDTPGTTYFAVSPLLASGEIYVNDDRLHPTACPFSDDPLWSAHGWEWFSLEEAAIGTNIITWAVDYRGTGSDTLKSRPEGSGVDGWLDLLPAIGHVVGEFGLTADNAIVPATALELDYGSWHEQGLPYYAGAVTYQQWVNVPNGWANCRVFLELSRMRDVAGVWLNGRSCGVCFTSPYRFDVSRRVLRGAANELKIRVWNSAEAALEGHLREPVPSGLLGPARLAAYPIVHPTVHSRS